MEQILSWIVFLPLVAGAILLLVPESAKSVFRYTTAVVTGIQLLLVLVLSNNFKGKIGFNNAEGFQFLQKLDWIDLPIGSLGRLNIDYLVGMDGLNYPLVLLSGIIFFIGAISAFEVEKKVKGFHILYLVLSGSVFGCFVALDLFLFYVFFEFMLLPMYFLIGIWGGARREYAAVKFFLYTLVGSIMILVVMIGIYASNIEPVETAKNIGLISEASEMNEGILQLVQQKLLKQDIVSSQMVKSFNLVSLPDAGNLIPEAVFALKKGNLLFGLDLRLWGFLLLLIGFAIKLPAVPVHTWLPDAHVEAPTTISVILAGVLLKIGGYGLMRIAYAIFPDGALYFSTVIGFFGVLAIIYAALVALGSTNLKKMIAYSSVSHMGFVSLGLASLTAEGVSGAVYQMYSHGLISGMLFLVAGVLYKRTHNLMIENYRGIQSVAPMYGGFVAIAFFASLGLPGFSGFIAEILVFLGAFASANQPYGIPMWMTVTATLGLVITAAYYLWTYQRMFLGKFWLRDNTMAEKKFEVTAREKFMLGTLAILIFYYGVMPNAILDNTNLTVNHFIDFVSGAGHANLEAIGK